MLVLLNVIWFKPGAVALEITAKTEHISLVPDTRRWLDESGRATLEVVRSKAEFEPVKGRTNLGTDDRVYWYRIPLHAAYQGSRTLVLASGYGDMETRAFLVSAGGRVREILPWRYGNRYSHFTFDLEGPDKYQLYLRVHGIFHTVILTLESLEAYAQSSQKSYALNALYYGALLVMVVFNLLLFISLRDTVYLYYVAALLTYGMFQLLSVDRSLPRYFNDMEFHGTMGLVAALLNAVTVTAFAQKLLNTRSLIPKWHRWLNLVYFYSFGIMASLPFISMQTQMTLVPPLGFAIPAVLIGTGILALRKDHPAARYYLTAWAVYLTGLIGFTLSVFGVSLFGWGPEAFNRLVKICSAGEITLFALALGARYNAMKVQVIEWQQRIIEMGDEQAQVLENRVARRTGELELANKTKDKFFSIIAHDLRGPLGNLSLIFNDIVSSGDQINDELFEILKTTTKSTSEMLENLLYWARNQQGKLDFEPVNFDLDEMIRKTLTVFSSSVEQKEIHLENRVAPLSFAYGDRPMAATIVRNLVGNALKFTPQGGQVSVSTEDRGGFWEISVMDNGRGMSAEVLEELFKLDRNTSLEIGGETGAGLGLILCKEFVEKNGGEIDVESEPGKGSRFRFTLPKGKAPKTERVDLRTLIRGWSVLVAEDNDLHFQTITNVLKNLELNIQQATDGQQALEEALNRNFDLILMDIDLPGINGIEVTRQLRADSSRKRRIIAITSYSKKEVEKMAEGVSFDCYMDKPLDQEAFLHCLALLVSSNG